MTNKTVYQYDLKGVLKNIPKDSKGFTVRGTFYDNNGQVIKDVDTHLDYYSYYTEKSEPTSIASLQNYEFVNVSKIQLTIMNPDGNVVFDKSYDYDMDEDIIEKYNVGDKLPVLMILDENDKEVKRLVGEKTKEEILYYIKL